jgi:hypothetical protein
MNILPEANMWLIKPNIYYLLLLVILVTYLAGMFVPVMEVDAALFIRDKQINPHKVVGDNAYGHALSYYLDTIVPFYWDFGDIRKLENGTVVYTNSDGLLEMGKSDMNFRVIQTFNEFNVTHLTFQFLNPATREEAVTKRHLVMLVTPEDIDRN